jgi:hypothetical protein
MRGCANSRAFSPPKAAPLRGEPPGLNRLPELIETNPLYKKSIRRAEMLSAFDKLALFGFGAAFGRLRCMK